MVSRANFWRVIRSFFRVNVAYHSTEPCHDLISSGEVVESHGYFSCWFCKYPRIVFQEPTFSIQWVLNCARLSRDSTPGFQCTIHTNKIRHEREEAHNNNNNNQFHNHRLTIHSSRHSSLRTISRIRINSTMAPTKSKGGGIKGFFTRAATSFQQGFKISKDAAYWLAMKSGRIGLVLASTSMVVLMPLIFEINREITVRLSLLWIRSAERLLWKRVRNRFHSPCFVWVCHFGNRLLKIASIFFSFWSMNIGCNY